MGKRQAELPNTRRDDEPPVKSIAELDDACDELEKRNGKVTKAGQLVVEQKRLIDELLKKHGLSWYPYESSTGVEKKVFVKTAIAVAKVKKAKLDDSDDDEGEE